MAAHEPMSHQEAIELLPWLANESLDAGERDAVQRHATDCVICRRELAELSALRRSIGSEAARVEAPEPDMRRINARIDAQLERELWPRRLLATVRAWLGSPMRIAFVAQSAALIAIAAVWLQPSDTDPAYRTLTTAEPLPAGHYVRVVFDPGVDDAGVASLLEPTDLTVVAGPSARGVVTLRFADDTGGDERDAIIRQMREDGRVLFAEAVDSGG